MIEKFEALIRELCEKEKNNEKLLETITKFLHLLDIHKSNTQLTTDNSTFFSSTD